MPYGDRSSLHRGCGGAAARSSGAAEVRPHSARHLGGSPSPRGTLAVQSLRGFDGVDDTAAKFLLQQALKLK